MKEVTGRRRSGERKEKGDIEKKGIIEKACKNKEMREIEIKEGTNAKGKQTEIRRFTTCINSQLP